jgi:DNA-binding LacI/PurR family transcriptional regulator
VTKKVCVLCAFSCAAGKRIIRCSDKTKKAVVELAQQLHYTPNSFAVNLRTKESKTIGLIIPEVMHHFFSNIINAIIDEKTDTYHHTTI